MSDESAPVVAADAAVAPVEMDLMTAVQLVIKESLVADGLVRGLHECAKVLDRRQAHVCVLAESCDEEAYRKLVEALCQEHGIDLIKVPDGKQLGEWAGLARYDRSGNPKKIVRASCVVIRKFGKDSDALSFLMSHLKKN